MRFRALDSWRGIAALLVMLFHLSANGAFHGAPPIRHGGLSVPFFFVLSGFVISHAYGGRLNDGAAIARFVVRRFGRLYPLHLVTLGALVLLELVKWTMVRAGLPSGQAPFTGANDLVSLVANVFLLQAVIPLPDYSWNVPSWSISVEFYTYLMFCAVVATCRTRTILPGLLLVATSAAALMLFDLYAPGLRETQFRGLATCVCGFFAGHLVYRLFRRLNAPGPIGATAFEVAALAVIAVLYWFAPLDAAGAIAVFAAVVLVFAFDRGTISRVLSGQLWAFLGRISYSIYMVHFVVLAVLGGVLRAAQAVLHRPLYHAIAGEQMIDFGPTGTMDLLAAGYALSVIGLATLTCRWIELPGQSLFARITGARERAVPRTAEATF